MIWALVGAFVVVVIGVLVVRPRVGKLFTGDFQGVKTESLVGPIVTLAVFLSAFVVAQALGTYQRTVQASSQEAAAVELMFENAGLLPDQQGAALQGTAICYSRAVANLEFPALADGETASAVDWWAGEFNQQIPAVIEGPSAVVGQIVSLNRQQTEARASRINDSRPNLPVYALVLMVLAVLGVLLALSSLAIPDMRQRVVFLFVGTLAALLGGTLFLIEQLEEPFGGVLQVTPNAMVNAANRMDASFPVGFPRPCDEDGRPVPVASDSVPSSGIGTGSEPLVVCTNASFRPMNYVDPASGYAGFDIELAAYLAEKTSRNLVIEEQPLDRLSDAVNVGLCDAVVSAYTVTPSRTEAVDFTQPYLMTDLAVLARSGTTIDGTGAAALTGRRIGVQSGSSAQQYLNDNRPARSTIVTFRTNDEVLAALRNGGVDVALKPLTSAQFDASTDPGLAVVATLGLDQQFAVAVAKGADEQFRSQLDAAISAAREDGTLDRLTSKYLATPATR
jgi:polar amino acid transport system substrate-binding protein